MISLIVYPLRPVQDPDFAEVLTDLNSRELFWLSRGQLEIAVETEGLAPRRISGFITGRKSCDSKCDTGNMSPIFPPSIFHQEALLRHQTRGVIGNVRFYCTWSGCLHVWLFASFSLYKYLLFVHILSTLITPGRNSVYRPLC